MTAPADIAIQGPAPRTLAQAARERRDIVSGQVMDEAALVRFVAGPDGAVVPDLARKLPGRGMWGAADRASVAASALRNAPATLSRDSRRSPPRSAPARRPG